jgi:hypothetical protein
MTEKEVLEFIFRRRSVRKFTGDPVPKEKIEALLRAAMAAPSARNRQPWEFLVITDREKIREVCTAHPYAKFGVDAGAVIIPLGKPAGNFYFFQDMAAVENLLLAAANLGLGATCPAWTKSARSSSGRSWESLRTTGFSRSSLWGYLRKIPRPAPNTIPPRSTGNASDEKPLSFLGEGSFGPEGI